MRSSGILLPISALPSNYGIGTVGKEACDFIDWLEKCKQRFWQILPIGPTGYGDSPYQSFSAYAGNPYWIDLDILASEELLTSAEIKKSGLRQNPGFIDYGDLYEKRFELLRKAAFRISPSDEGFLCFCRENQRWIFGYALFMALKVENGMAPLHLWPEKERSRDSKTMEEAAKRLKDEMHFWSALQYLFYRQWRRFKEYANSKAVMIIGDIPIYVSPDSSDLWENYRLFQANSKMELKYIAGCPPDYFNVTGQRWGNPLYDWDYHRKTGYDWWIKRLTHAGEVFDVVRIDHFRGFAGYYSIPAENETAEYGEWKKGPGKKFISAILEKAPGLRIIAEDLGFLTPDVRRLLEFSGFPGMKVLQFAFDPSAESDYLPHKYPENSVAYTGTHDNPTTREWVDTAQRSEWEFAKRYLKVNKKSDLADEIVRAAMLSKSNLCIIPLQDWLRLGKTARINTPGTTDGNWRFRVRKAMLSEESARKIRLLTEESGRAEM